MRTRHKLMIMLSTIALTLMVAAPAYAQDDTAPVIGLSATLVAVLVAANKWLTDFVNVIVVRLVPKLEAIKGNVTRGVSFIIAEIMVVAGDLSSLAADTVGSVNETVDTIVAGVIIAGGGGTLAELLKRVRKPVH